eukprot:3443512-Prymnesium_polylepis.1
MEHRANLATAKAKCEDNVKAVKKACAESIKAALRDADDRVADAKIKLKKREEKVEGVEKLMHKFRQEAKKEAQERANIEIRKAEQEAKAAIAAMKAAEAK